MPAIISWPGHLPEGEVRGQLVHSCDWLPTLADFCGVKLLANDIDGKDIRAVIQNSNATSPHQILHWTMGKQWAVREGDWKLIANPQDTSKKGPLSAADKFFLSNPNEDKTEMTNFAATHPEEVQRLQKLHQEWVSTLH